MVGKECPHCHAPVDAGVRKCVACGEFVETPDPEVWRLELINLQILFAVLEAKTEAVYSVFKELHKTGAISLDFKSLQDYVRNATYQNITEFFEEQTPQVLYEFSKALTKEWTRRGIEDGENLEVLSRASWSYLHGVLENLGVDAETFKEWARRRNVPKDGSPEGMP